MHKQSKPKQKTWVSWVLEKSRTNFLIETKCHCILSKMALKCQIRQNSSQWTFPLTLRYMTRAIPLPDFRLSRSIHFVIFLWRLRKFAEFIKAPRQTVETKPRWLFLTLAQSYLRSWQNCLTNNRSIRSVFKNAGERSSWSQYLPISFLMSSANSSRL